MTKPNLNWTLKQTVEFNPILKDVLKNIGFDQVDNQQLLDTLGATITLSQAAATKDIDAQALIKQIHDSLISSGDVTLGDNASSDNAELFIAGLLPCPVRVPLMESFENYASNSKTPLKYVLKAASEGAAWVEEHLQDFNNIDSIPDIFISAGFELYFDKTKMGKLKADGVFKDLSPFKQNCINKDFDKINLVDPDGHYSMIATVPAVFLVNTNELHDEPLPKTWEDILHPRFAGRVSLPVSDFDLFNAIILTIQKRFGDKGVKDLGRSMATAMHPAEMVKGAKGKGATKRPTVTIMPYFFTKMAKGNGPMQAVWPEDGAIISPIFMLAKASKAQKLQPIIDLFSSLETAEILAHKGLFPSLHPNIDNKLNQNAPWQWLGWDYIKKTDLTYEIQRCLKIFEEAQCV